MNLPILHTYIVKSHDATTFRPTQIKNLEIYIKYARLTEIFDRLNRTLY